MIETSKSHPLRHSITSLFHERALPVFQSPVSIRCSVFIVEDSERAQEKKWLLKSAGEYRYKEDNGLFQKYDKTDGLIFEKHGEFSTYTQYHCFNNEKFNEDIILNTLGNIENPWIDGAIGEVFRCIEINVFLEPPSEELLNKTMDISRAVCCDVFDGKARIWSDFRGRVGGAGRVIIHDKGLENDELSRLVQSIIEIGNYRKLALLGFAPAREIMGWIKKADKRLGTIIKELANPENSDVNILHNLMDLAAEVEHLIHQTNFRFGATEAYYKLTKDRLNSLREERISGFSTMQEFVERRLTPAMRTCEAAAGRLEDLSSRISKVNDLLRTKVSTNLEFQNQSLLQSMEKRARLQMELSELVEGLSVFALSYYIFGLVKYILESIISHQIDILHKLYAPIIFAILAFTFYFIHLRKRKITKKH